MSPRASWSAFHPPDQGSSCDSSQTNQRTSLGCFILKLRENFLSFPLDQRQVNFFCKRLDSKEGVLPSGNKPASGELEPRRPPALRLVLLPPATKPAGREGVPVLPGTLILVIRGNVKFILHMGPGGLCEEPRGFPVVLSGSNYWEKRRKLINDRPIKDPCPEGTKVWVIPPQLRKVLLRSRQRRRDVG